MLEVTLDHVHLLVTALPTVAPADIAKTLKSISAVEIFATYPKLKQRKFWGSGMWSPSTYYGTVGDTDESAVSNYIDKQKRPSARRIPAYKGRGVAAGHTKHPAATQQPYRRCT